MHTNMNHATKPGWPAGLTRAEIRAGAVQQGRQQARATGPVPCDCVKGAHVTWANRDDGNVSVKALRSVGL